MKKVIFIPIIVLVLNCILFIYNSKNLICDDEFIQYENEFIIEIIEGSTGKIEYYEETDVDKIDTKKYKIRRVSVGATSKHELAKKLKSKYKDKGYLIFFSNLSYDKSNESIYILKGDNQMDILRALKTSGVNYEISTENIIDKLNSWDNKYGIEVLGADYDWVEIEFKKSNLDVNNLCKEIEEFCPDIIYQGVGSVEALEEYIILTSKVFLWWD